MPALIPFRALRPAADQAAVFSVPPYDVLSAEDSKKLKAKNPNSMIRITRSEVDRDEYGAYNDYELAQRNLEQYVSERRLQLDARPSYTIYRETFQGRSQTGIVALVKAKDYREGRIKRHELTLPEKQMDRTKHFLACQAQTEPVFLFAPHFTLEAAWTAQPPSVDFTDEDGVRHQCWEINDPEQMKAIQWLGNQCSAFYIADGHHRTASAVTVAEQEPHTHVMAVVFPETDLHLLPYHRVVHHVTAEEIKTMKTHWEKDFHVEEITWDQTTPETGTYIVFMKGASYRLTYRHAAAETIFLDAKVIQEDLLEPYFHITDPRTDPRLSFFGGLDQVTMAENMAQMEGNLVIYMPPAAMETIRQVADSGGIMPPKSTWFEPKLKSGLWLYPYQANDEA